MNLVQIRPETGILHVRATQDSSLVHLLASVDDSYTVDRVRHWLKWGCVYVDGVRQREDLPVKQAQLIRLHTRPKRYVWPQGHLRERIIFEDEHFLVLDKPPGLPTHPTLDNYVENVKFQLEAELGQRVYVTHRLDINTQGLLILAKSNETQAAINKLFREGRVGKVYRCVTQGPLPLGEMQDWMNPHGRRAPREISPRDIEGWWQCRLDVLHCEPWGEGFRSVIRLHTGRTHQIRAQLAARGEPILGDKLYGSLSEGEMQLESYAIQFRFLGRDYAFVRSADAAQVARYVVAEVHQRHPFQWLSTPRPSSRPSVASEFPSWIEPLVNDHLRRRLTGIGDERALLSRFCLRGVREDSYLGLVGWLEGRYPLRLRFDIPTPRQMLDLQCDGQRYVTWLKGQSHPVGRHAGFFEFLLHDLEHAHKFFAGCYQGQWNFFRYLRAALPLLTGWPHDDHFHRDLEYIMSDMNSHPVHMLKYLKAIVLAATLRATGEPSANLNDFWQNLFDLWRMPSHVVAAALHLNHPGVEQESDHRVLTKFFEDHCKV